MISKRFCIVMELSICMEINMLVGRKSYECDLVFRIIDLLVVEGEEIAILSGADFRLVADAMVDDLVPISNEQRSEKRLALRELEKKSLQSIQERLLALQHSRFENENGSTNLFQIPGRVLHLDGDASYLNKCLDLYKQLGVTVYGVHCNEKEMHMRIDSLIEDYRPDVLVITGHDAYIKSKGEKYDLQAYRHSKYFVQTVENARRKIPHLDQLIIFAGACQSHFESLIFAGANYASSPQRVNIHALDPVYIVAKVCFTHFMDKIQIWDILDHTITGDKGIGGLESKGVLRIGMPYEQGRKRTD